jgi:hypothetical protein
MKVGKIVVLLAVLVLFGTCAYAKDCNIGGRYEDNNDGTVTDCKTGLVWLKNAKCTDTSNTIPNPNGYLTWYNAQKWVAGLGNGMCDLNDGSAAGDWRLPTKTEWMAMVAYAKRTPLPAYSNPALTDDIGTSKWTEGNVFNNVLTNDYWSSTTSAINTVNAWVVYMLNGLMYNINKSNDYYVWPVRGGQSGTFGSLRIE